MEHPGHVAGAAVPGAAVDSGAGDASGNGSVHEAGGGRDAAALAEENAFLRSVLASMFNAVLIVRDSGIISTVNHAAALLLGCSADAIVGRHVSEFIPIQHYSPSDEGDVVADLLRADEEQTWITRQGKPVPVLVSSSLVLGTAGEILGAACVAVDLRERKHLEANLRHAQKMESVGTLASGIAHEINTPIQYVSDTVHFLRESFGACERLLDCYRAGARELAGACGQEDRVAGWEAEEESADYEYLRAEAPRAFERALDGIGRVATIVRAMKDFAHPNQREKAPADLNQAVSSTLTVARNEYKYVADVKTDLGELPKVTCHVGDLNQVFLNLIVNAAHAIQDVVGQSDTRGTISIRTRADGADHVVVEISDTGGGIPQAIRDRIYDPFFTTKSVGRGTGQGLAIARSIVVDKHHGSITFDSTVGQGTTFKIRLPVSAS